MKIRQSKFVFFLFVISAICDQVFAQSDAIPLPTPTVEAPLYYGAFGESLNSHDGAGSSEYAAALDAVNKSNTLVLLAYPWTFTATCDPSSISFNGYFSEADRDIGYNTFWDIGDRKATVACYDPMWGLHCSGGCSPQYIAAAGHYVVDLAIYPVCPYLDGEPIINGAKTCLNTFKFSILSVTQEDNPAPKNNNNFYSIPSVGQANSTDRYFTIRVLRDKNWAPDLIKVELENGAGGNLMEILNTSIPDYYTYGVSSFDDTSTTSKITVRVSMKNINPSNVDGNPPPTNLISYRFILGNRFAGDRLNKEIAVTGKNALWRGASVLPSRYGARDSGGDDWVSQGAYNWLQTNRGLINAVDDTSGEHGRNIGHETHQYGSDIDTYHFYSFPGDSHGGLSNFYRLRDTIITATGIYNQNGTLNPNPPQAAVSARDQLINFVTVTRAGIDQLAGLDSVYLMYYMIGEQEGDNWPYSDNPVLKDAWAQDLIHKGKVTVDELGVVYNLDLGLGDWKCTKLRHNSVHDSHLHIMLNRAVIGDL